MNFIQRLRQKWRDHKRGLRKIPEDKVLRDIAYIDNELIRARAGWNRLAELWPDLDIEEVKRLNPSIRPFFPGSIVHTKAKR